MKEEQGFIQVRLSWIDRYEGRGRIECVPIIVDRGIGTSHILTVVPSDPSVKRHVVIQVRIVIPVRPDPELQVGRVERTPVQGILPHYPFVTETEGKYGIVETVPSVQSGGRQCIISSERFPGNLLDPGHIAFTYVVEGVVLPEIGPVPGIYAHLEWTALFRAEHEV